MNMGTEIISKNGEAGTIIVPELAAEVVDALYPQWAVNGHNIAEAFAVVAERHVDPAIRETAATTDLLPLVVDALDVVFWQRARAERQALRA